MACFEHMFEVATAVVAILAAIYKSHSGLNRGIKKGNDDFYKREAQVKALMDAVQVLIEEKKNHQVVVKKMDDLE